jgi:hypothetical protein
MNNLGAGLAPKPEDLQYYQAVDHAAEFSAELHDLPLNEKGEVDFDLTTPRTVYIKPVRINSHVNSITSFYEFTHNPKGPDTVKSTPTFMWMYETDDQGNIKRDADGNFLHKQVPDPKTPGQMINLHFDLRMDKNGSIPLELPRDRYIIERYLLKFHRVWGIPTNLSSEADKIIMIHDKALEVKAREKRNGSVREATRHISALPVHKLAAYAVHFGVYAHEALYEPITHETDFTTYEDENLRMILSGNVSIDTDNAVKFLSEVNAPNFAQRILLSLAEFTHVISDTQEYGFVYNLPNGGRVDISRNADGVLSWFGKEEAKPYLRDIWTRSGYAVFRGDQETERALADVEAAVEVPAGGRGRISAPKPAAKTPVTA